MFWPAWVSTFTENLVKKAFTATGICPVNPDVILKRFRHISPDSSESVSSGSTAYSAEDWLKACTTLQTEVKDSRSVGARKLGQTIHHLSSQVELLQFEVDGLRKKLYQNRKRQKQSNMQLDLQQHQEYHGGAIMWSSRAFREARTRMAVAEQEAQEEELKKAEMRYTRFSRLMCVCSSLSQAPTQTSYQLFSRGARGCHQSRKVTSFPLFWKAEASSFKELTILNSSKLPVYYRSRPDVILKRFTNTNTDEQGSRESST